MNHLVPLSAFSALFLLTACKTPKQLDVDPAQLKASVEAIPAAPEDDQPVMMIRVDEGHLPNLQTIQFVIPGVSGAGMAASQPGRALEYRISRYLNNTKRFKVVSYDEVAELKKLQQQGMLPEDAPDARGLKPDYSVTCTIIEMNPGEQNSGGGWGVGPVRWGSAESIATVKLAVKVVSLRPGDAGRTIWDGEAEGTQSSKATNLGVNVGLFSHDKKKSTSPTLDDATEFCVMDLVTKLSEHVPTLSGGTTSMAAGASAASATPAAATQESASKQAQDATAPKND
ncbi:MAG: hypothetical protein R3F56_00225 [Planctomycetota bacterium]